MKIEVEIPKEFEEYCNQDVFEEALDRLTTIMIVKAFKGGKITEEEYKKQIIARGYERLEGNLEIMEEMGRLKTLDEPVILENGGYRINITAQFNLPYGLPFRDNAGYGSEYEAYYGSLRPTDGGTEEIMLFFRDGDNNLFISERIRDDFVSNTEAYIMAFKDNPFYKQEDAYDLSNVFLFFMDLDKEDVTRIADFIKDRGGQEPPVNATELQERHNKNDAADDFITISVSKKRVVQNFPVKTDNGSVEYSKILAPGGVSFLRKSDQIHEDSNNPDKVVFSLHKSNKIKIERRTDTVEGHTPAGKPIYHIEKEEISPEVLKRIYDEEGKQRHNGTDISAPQEPIPVPSRGR